MFERGPDRRHGDESNHPGAAGPWATWDEGDRHISVAFSRSFGGEVFIGHLFCWSRGSPTMHVECPGAGELDDAWAWLNAVSVRGDQKQ